MSPDVVSDAAVGSTYISTEHLPYSNEVTASVRRAYERSRRNTEGKNSDVYPALASVRSDLFGVCVVGTSGNVYSL